MKENRHALILQYLDEFYDAKAIELAEQFQVSVETIRRDLNILAKQGRLHRTHGGALSQKTRDIGRSFDARQRVNSEKKISIAQMVVPLLFPDAVIAFDASSTAWHVAQRIPNIPCTVISSSMRTICSLSHKPHIKTIATGGVYSEKYDAFYGPLSEQLLSRLKIDIAILSCSGVTEHGIWESNEINTAFKRKLIASANQVFLLVDNSKVGREDLIHLAELSVVDKLFTQQLASDEIVQACQAFRDNCPL